MTNYDKPKTQPTDVPVADYLSSIKDGHKRQDAEQLCQLMSQITGKKPVIWGSSIVGFDQKHYKYESGREGDMGAIGFAPRKSNLTIYLVDGTSKYSELLNKLGPHKTGKVCLYIKRLDGINIKILTEIVKNSYNYVKNHEYDKP